MFNDMHARDVRVANKCKKALVVTVIISAVLFVLVGFFAGMSYAVKQASLTKADSFAKIENESLKMQVHALTVERDYLAQSNVAMAKK